ncbi:MAG TPA: SdrD B-like domain-containing protein [Humisphaera sp.]|jgi:hypothetical protein|nr:SdrD B-like domain-containing protein [Humisphaera sp.]
MRTALIEDLEPRRLLTVLPFQPAIGSFANGSALPQAYGDRVNAAVQNNFKYSITGGTTPNVVADYGTNGKTVVARTTGFGDLSGVVSTNSHAPFEMILTADTGFKVSLSSFDLAGSPSHDWTIKSVQVVDGNNNPLYSKTNVVIQGDATGTRHTHIAFTTPFTASRIKIRFDASNLTGTAAVGLDNVQFSQVKIAPLPATISGNVFNDLSRDGVKAASGEPGLSGWRVYLDQNNDGIFQSTETSTLSDVNGNYSFSVAAGSYHVAEVLQTGWQRTAPTGSYAITATAGQKITGKNFGDAVLVTDPVISVGNYSAAVGSQVSIQLKVSDLGNVTAQDIEGMTFTVQIDSGTGTAPTIASVDLLTGTVWAGHGSSVFVPSGGSQPQFKTFSVLTGADGNFINPNGLLATIVLNTAGATAGQYAIKLVGTKISAFDTQFQNHLGLPVKSLIINGTLKLT